MVAHQHQHEVAVRPQPEIAADVGERVPQRLDVAGAQVRPVGPGGPRAVEVFRVVGGVAQHPRPVGLVGRSGHERRMGGDGGEEHEGGPAVRGGDLGRVDPREGVLVVDVPPPERRPPVVEARVVVDVLEAVEGALGPTHQETRHDRDGAVAAAPEQLHQGVPLLGHEAHVVGGVAHLRPREQADVGEPRLAAEGGRLDERRRHAAAGLGDRRLQPPPRRGQGLDEGVAVPAHRPVRLEEDDEHVGAGDPRQVGTHRRRRTEVAQAGPARLVGELAQLARERGRHRLGHPDAARRLDAAPLRQAEQQHRDGRAAERPARHRPRRGGRNAPPGPARHEVEAQGNENEPRDEPRLEPRVGHEGEHRAHLRHVLQVPVQVHLAAVEGGDGHLDVPPSCQRQPAEGQPAHRGARRAPPPGVQGHEEQHAGRRLRRQVAVEPHPEGRPDVGEGERDVHQQEGRAGGRDAPHRGEPRSAPPRRVDGHRCRGSGSLCRRPCAVARRPFGPETAARGGGAMQRRRPGGSHGNRSTARTASVLSTRKPA